MKPVVTLWTRRVVIGLAAAWGLAFLLIVVARIGFPLELEWMEGGVLHQAHRLLEGEPIYPPPGRDFVPFLYTPGYAVVVAGLGSVFGVDYALGRIVSVIACVAIGWAMWRAVGREGKPRAHQAVAVGLFCSGYIFTFRWLDLARPDALYMALTLWGLVLLRESWGDHRKAVLAGVLIALGFWTKQTAATFIVASAVGALLVAPRQLFSYAATIAVIDGGGVLIGNAVTDGWLWHYIYELHQQHAFNHERFRTKTWGMFVHAAPFLVLLAVLGWAQFLAPWLRRSRVVDKEGDERRRQRLRAGKGLLYWAVMAATGLLVSALGYSTQWAEPNAFIPGVVMGAIFLAVALPERGWAEVVGLGLAGAQLLFAMLVEPMYQPIQNKGWAGFSKSYAWQDLSRTIPSDDAKANAAARRAALESAAGEVLALQRPFWSVLAGGGGHIGSMGINDVLPEPRREIQQTLIAEVKAGQFAEIWLDGEPPAWLLPALKGYRVERRFHGKDRVRPMSGYMSVAGMVTPYRADQLFLVPVAPRLPPGGGQVVADFEDGTAQGFTFQGSAFGRRPIGGKAGKLPLVGPYGGEFLLSSAGRRGDPKLEGVATSPEFTLPDGGHLEFLLGTTGKVTELAVYLTDGDREVGLTIPKTRLELAPVRWDVPADWAGASVRLVLEDTGKHALFFDDLWVIPK